ncbi:ABC transporter ATP-binding protein [Helicobacter sp. MIT 99-5507]|uniref:ABC transporter ATP-binding protein n=1 Tax=Helicobacter sp. MIT 99-5507 TaxID=152489 RepID=UPI000E1FA77A|nr:ATP-binding cassette domain-containing protein [Helicobacter sp. MIT 99-5507]RDU56532.1 ABC transporter ATP-binding protein [Helicobacter sp. MIT 99-5507]
MNLIQAKGLSHSFEHLLYDDVNIDIKEKESVAVLGVSGSGKSSLINNLSTLLKPKSGIVNLNGKNDIYSINDDEILSIRKNEIGIIFQSHYLFRGFNVLENLKVASILTNQKIDMDLLEKFGISDLLKQQIGELSGGQQQRLSIARVLQKKPKIIFADEPTGNLDKNTSIKVMEVVFNYLNINNAAMLIATHDIEIANMCDRIFYLKDCKLVETKK